MDQTPAVETTSDVVVPSDARVTIENCEDEPIRIPGSIQRHGFLLVLDEAGERVVAASENTSEFLELPLNLILGTSVENVLEREVLAVIRGLAHTEEIAGQMTYLGSFPMRAELYSVVTHLVDGKRVLEFERVEHLVSPELTNAILTNFVGKLSKLKNEAELCQAITKQVSDLTGFNRTLLYSFDEVGHGTVLAEENDGVLPSYLDLRFPASDIPKQARELYLLNTVRIIPNANYVPSPLQGVAKTSMKTFDLSSSTLRSVSPIHLEYMRNMGTMSSMSISLVCEGKLWGLLSCHNAEPRSVAYVVRSVCDLLTKMVGTQLMAFESATRLEQAIHFHGVQRRILTHMAAENDYLKAMTSQMGELAQVTNADGVTLVIDGVCASVGKTPTETAVLRIATYLDTQTDLKLFSSRSLKEELEWAAEIEDVASGLVAIRISDVRQNYVMWFRPQIVKTVKWAGEPEKAKDAIGSLHPRVSFDIWQHQVHGKSAPWTEMELESAQEFRSAVVTISLKRAEEAVDISEARFQELTHSLPNLVWAADDDGNLTYVNERWRQEELAPEGLWFQQERFAAEDRTRCEEQWSRAVHSGSSFEMELQLRGNAGAKDQLTLVRAVPFRRSNGDRAGWVGTFTDLTERKERELAMRMTEKLALTGRMTSVIAHEINNPLEAITNLHYLLAHEVVGNEPALAYIAQANGELERISGITKQTLRWSKENLESPQQVYVTSLFEDVVRLFRGKIRNREVTVITSDEQLPVYGVVGQIRQVLVNLFSNALDASPIGGRIWLATEEFGDRVQILVTDEGGGMSIETQRQIFDPFYSTKGDLGNGLGLYISHEIVERHKGRILVDSAIGKGTKMAVQLPKQKAS
jgi:PAS domain S-box-containing protein